MALSIIDLSDIVIGLLYTNTNTNTFFQTLTNRQNIIKFIL